MAILDLVQYPNERNDEIVHRIPEEGSGEFRLGSQLVVREGQRAVWMRDGRVMDVMPPGRHTLTTDNIPLLTGLIGLPFGGKSPFTAEVYFVSMRDFTDFKWGTPQPLVFRDSELGMIRLRAYGTFAIRVADPAMFVGQMVGARGAYTTSQIEEYLRSIILGEFNDVLGKNQTSILDMQGMTGGISAAAKALLTDDFLQLGLDLRNFVISSITPPEEVQSKIDERSSMAALGDMNTYMQFKAAQAIGEAAKGTGGEAAAGVGIGAGFGMGAAMAGSIANAFSGAGANAGPSKLCPKCNAANPPNARFCLQCGTNLMPENGATCSKCNKVNPAGAKFCVDCGTPLA